MQGVEILNKEPVMIADERLVIAGVICIVIAIVCIFIAINSKEEVMNTFLGGFVVFVLTAFVLALSYKTTTIPSDRYQYEATIDEDVSINEVYKYYDVIEQKGKKWILEDKEK